ncbi:MAG: reverse transcriptase domain-containing protein [Candidatus Marithrix sp.]
MHLIDDEFLHAAYELTRKDGASGIDGMTAKEYAENLEGNLKNLLERMKSGKYFAPPVKRVWIDKEDGKQRPLGITTFEDKVVQRTVAMLLGAVYEHDFYDFSHGFRPHHSAHQALHEVRERCRLQNTQYIVDADVTGYFDNIDHELLRQFIKRKINDGMLIRFVGKWLNAGVMDGNSLSQFKEPHKVGLFHLC